MTKEVLQKLLDEERSYNARHRAETKVLKDENEKLKKSFSEVSEELQKLQSFQKSLFEFLKPQIKELIESYEDKVQHMINDSINEDHAAEYEHSLGYDA